MMNRRKVAALGSALVFSALAFGAPLAAGAADTSATATITGGNLTFNAVPATAGLGVTLNGQDQTATTTNAMDVWDDTGSGAGWNITATSTAFKSGSHVMSNSATTVQDAPIVTGDDGVNTFVPANNVVSYPYTLPAGAVAPTATKIFSADIDTGLGHQTATATMSLFVPRTTYSGVYTSTWTYSLVSAP